MRESSISQRQSTRNTCFKATSRAFLAEFRKETAREKQRPRSNSTHRNPFGEIENALPEQPEGEIKKSLPDRVDCGRGGSPEADRASVKLFRASLVQCSRIDSHPESS